MAYTKLPRYAVVIVKGAQYAVALANRMSSAHTVCYKEWNLVVQ